MIIFVAITYHYPNMDKDINRIKVVLAEKENQQMVGRTTWLCADYCFKVVYQRLSASDGDVSADSEITGSRD